jgi:NitT/TauT family transport system permease protein
VPVLRRLPAIDAPAVLPHLLAACQVGVGLAWKSGITAEVIGLPQGSIGERLYQAKIFLSTADLFAWTIVIIALSFLFERVVRALLTRLEVRVGRVGS